MQRRRQVYNVIDLDRKIVKSHELVVQLGHAAKTKLKKQTDYFKLILIDFKLSSFYATGNTDAVLPRS
jgi:hypothetical protein